MTNAALSPVDVLPGEQRGEQLAGRSGVGTTGPASTCGPRVVDRSCSAGTRPPRCGTRPRTGVPRRPRAGSARTGSCPGCEAGLVGVRDDRRVEQRRRLHRVLVGEPGADQVRGAARTGPRRRAPGARSARSAPQHARQVAVPAGVAGEHPAQRGADLVLGQRQDPASTPDARDRPSWESSWPGTNSRASTRAGSAASTIGPVCRHELDTHATAARPDERAGLLQRGQQRQCRLSALVLVAPGRAPDRRNRRRRPDRAAAMPTSLAPRNQRGRARSPSAQRRRPGDRDTPARRRRPARPPRSAAGRSRARRHPARARPPGPRTAARPGSADRAASPADPARRRPSDGRVQRGARGEQGLGQHGVGVAQPRLGPRPCLVERRPPDRRRGRDEQRPRSGVPRLTASTSAAPSAA